MTEPDENDEDFEDPEDFAEAVPIDPTPQEVDEYQERITHSHHAALDHDGGMDT